MEAAAANTTYGGNITYSTGITVATGTGKAPERTPTELIATRAVEAKDGWLGQIIMAGEIVYESKPQKNSRAALGKVNRRVHDAFKRLIVGI
jgi:hypothetical protein